MQQQEIKEFEAINVKVSDLVFDEANPNQLTQEQMHGLREAMKRFGYLQPIIIDQDNKIADGEHRALVYKEFGINEIPAYRIDLTNDNERKLLRQVMNKLRGTHDLTKDAQEIQILQGDNLLSELSTLIGQNEQVLTKLLKEYEFANLDVTNDQLLSDTAASSKEIDGELKTDHQCPKCGYAW